MATATSLLGLLLVLGVLLRGLDMDMRATRGLVWSRVLARLMVLVVVAGALVLFVWEVLSGVA